MERKNIIFVPKQEMNEEEMEHSEIVDWAFNNLLHPNVLVLTSDEVYDLQYQSEVLQIINEENHSMLEMYEDDWVIDQDVKSRIKERLNNYAKMIQNIKRKEITQNIIKLLDISIETNKGFYLNF